MAMAGQAIVSRIRGGAEKMSSKVSVSWQEDKERERERDTTREGGRKEGDGSVVNVMFHSFPFFTSSNCSWKRVQSAPLSPRETKRERERESGVRTTGRCALRCRIDPKIDKRAI